MMTFTHSFHVPMKWTCSIECVSIVVLLFQKYLEDFNEVFILKPTVNLDKKFNLVRISKTRYKPGFKFHDAQSHCIVFPSTDEGWESLPGHAWWIFWYFADRASQYIHLNINQLDALNFIMNLFHASTCFEHKSSSSGGQNFTIQSLVSTHL